MKNCTHGPQGRRMTLKMRGGIDPSIEQTEDARLLMIGDNEKAKLFRGFLARHFFRGMVEVSKDPNIFQNFKIILFKFLEEIELK